ncbi:unnamed protein product [Bursaphelenchus okinawaensis]|uniref:Uncharacterized protein n=1 Tax=Bursaphelenchus okinawaensis TaxID=465554 RepID=A0A811JV45_9BILA|nr:unnamed protein product [Bursaphelenchus okinawaensis]CAG9085234.1 unnamed protein product [Bursaphelenchus okinawaensis]
MNCLKITMIFILLSLLQVQFPVECRAFRQGGQGTAIRRPVGRPGYQGRVVQSRVPVRRHVHGHVPVAHGHIHGAVVHPHVHVPVVHAHVPVVHPHVHVSVVHPHVHVPVVVPHAHVAPGFCWGCHRTYFVGGGALLGALILIGGLFVILWCCGVFMSCCATHEEPVVVYNSYEPPVAYNTCENVMVEPAGPTPPPPSSRKQIVMVEKA